MTLPPMPWRVAAVVALAGAGAGAVLGFVLGLSYLPTLPVAVVEGGILVGVPAALLGLLVTAALLLVGRRRTPATPGDPDGGGSWVGVEDPSRS